MTTLAMLERIQKKLQRHARVLLEMERSGAPLPAAGDEYRRTMDLLADVAIAQHSAAAETLPWDGIERRQVYVPTSATATDHSYVSIYLLVADNGLWKIGRTRDLGRRRGALFHQSPVAIALHSYVDSHFTLEGWLHRHWKRYRRHGEWFWFPERLIPRVQRSMMAGDLLARRAAARGTAQDLVAAEQTLRLRAMHAAREARRLARADDAAVARQLQGQP